MFSSVIWSETGCLAARLDRRTGIGAVDLLVDAAHPRLQAERTVDEIAEGGGQIVPAGGSCMAEAVSSRTFDFSDATWSRVISPELAARCSSSQEATCISRVVSRIDSAA